MSKLKPLTKAIIERDILQVGEKYTITIISKTEGNLRGKRRQIKLTVIGCYPEHYLCKNEQGRKISLSKRDQYINLWKVEVEDEMSENIQRAVEYYVDWLKENPEVSMSTNDVLTQTKIGKFNNYYIHKIISSTAVILREEGFDIKMIEFCRSSKKGPHLILTKNNEAIVKDTPDNNSDNKETYVDVMAELIHERLETEKKKNADVAYDKVIEEELASEENIEKSRNVHEEMMKGFDELHEGFDELHERKVKEAMAMDTAEQDVGCSIGECSCKSSGQAAEENILLNIEKASINNFDTAFMISLNETICMLRKLNNKASIDIMVKVMK